MFLRLTHSCIPGGTITIPGSKSHTIRALFFASLASGRSVIKAPLISEDAVSAIRVCRAFGARIIEKKQAYEVEGFAGKPTLPDNVVDVGNSGTTMNFAIGMASLPDGISILTGDVQIRRRPIAPLEFALNNLGAKVLTTRNNGMPPVVVHGPAKGGRTTLDAPVSQYLSSLLIHAPLFPHDTTVTLTRLLEVPYVEMTLWWLDKFGIRYENDNFRRFTVFGGQKYNGFEETIPGDFSSATFFAVLAAISGCDIFMRNLDMNDVQGDKGVLAILQRMGATVRPEPGGVRITGGKLRGVEMDLNSMPDALCALAVAGCFAEGETRILNVPQARLKETDRIAVMAQELKRMGADIEELDDGLVVRRSRITGTTVEGHGDHRVVMSLAIAGLCAEGRTVVTDAEAASVTFPEFAEIVRACGGDIQLSKDLP